MSSDKEITEAFLNSLGPEIYELTGNYNEWLLSQSWITKKVNEKTQEIKYSINCPELAEYVKNSQQYIYVTTRPGIDPERYVYRDTGIYEPVSDNEVKGVIKSLIPQFLQRPREIEDTFKLLRYDVHKPIPRDNFNNNENIINFLNGLLDIRTNQLSDHTNSELMTVQLPVIYNAADNNSPTFDGFLDTLADGDEKIIKILLQFIGLAISNIDVSKTKTSLLLVGKGNTGKSQYSALVSRLVGTSNYTPTNLSMLENNRFESSRLFGKRLAVDDDMQQSKLKELSMFKKLTGGDLIAGEYKSGALFDFRFKGLFIFCANHFPSFGGDKGDHVYKRFVVIECNNVIPEDKQDKHLLDKMFKERTAIINKSLDALVELINSGYRFDLPEQSVKAVQQYKIDNSSVLSFLDECCTLRTDRPKRNDTVTTGRLFEAYKIWCDRYNNGYKAAKGEFKRTLIENYGDKSVEIRTEYGRYYKYTLTFEAKKALGITDIFVNTYPYE